MTRISRFAIPFAAAVALLGSATVVRAQSATLAWDANTEPDVSGYRLYYGTKSHTYTKAVDVGKVTTYKVTGLDISANYFFALQAYNSAGLSSGLSAEVELPAPVPPGTTVIKSLTANKNFPLLFGTPVTFTANATSIKGPVEYRFLLYSPDGAGWTELQAYSATSSITWTPAWKDLGTHLVQVWVRAIGSSMSYEAIRSTNTFTVNAKPLEISSDVDFPTPPGNPVHWHAEVAGASSTQLEYRYVALNKGTGVWSQLRGYSTNSDFTWTPTKTGNYQLQVWARQVGSTAAYDVYGAYGPFSISKTKLSVSLSVDAKLPTATGTTMTWTARPKGGTKGPIEYRFIRYSDATGWEEVQPYSTSSTYEWTPQWGEQGKYAIQVWARNNGSTASYDAYSGSGYFQVQLAPVQVSTDKVFPVPPGTSVKLTAQIADPTAAVEYRFIQYDRSTGVWSEARGYSTSKTYTWTPDSTGTFAFQVWARAIGSTAAYEVYGGTNYLDVSMTPAKVVSLMASSSFPAPAATPITWTAVASGGTASPLEYRFVLYTDGVGWTELKGWSTSNTVTWTPDGSGSYAVQVWVRSNGSTATYEDYKSSGMFTIQF